MYTLRHKQTKSIHTQIQKKHTYNKTKAKKHAYTETQTTKKAYMR